MNRYFMLLFALTISCGGKLLHDGADKQDLSPEFVLTFDDLATSWDEAIPLGNASLGALVWRKGDKLRISLDRADLWDLRPMANLDFENYGFDWVVDRWEKDRYKDVQDRYDVPYDRLPAPSKIPGGALEFDVSDLGPVESVKLILSDAICEVTWESGVIFQVFVHASKPVGWYRFEQLSEEISPVVVPPSYVAVKDSGVDNPVTGQDLRRLEYPSGVLDEQDGVITYNQKGWKDFSFQIQTRWHKKEDITEGCLSISSSNLDRDANEILSTEGGIKMDAAMKSHVAWWHLFWNQSSVSLPDSMLQSQWYMEMYKLGSAARQGAPPISLQSVWTADNGKLPPWKGDFHHDLNTQLSYWPTYSGNHLVLEQGFMDWLIANKPTFKKYTREFYGTAGLNVPGVTTLDGAPMGGWIQYSFGPTVGAWLGQHFYLHWRYTMDKEFLREEAYPWIRDVAIHLDELSILGEDGMRRLPLSSSPEIFGNSREAWFKETTNFDLALIRWTYIHAEELARILGLSEEAEQWNDRLTEWPELTSDSTGLLLAPGVRLEQSHRHLSHAMAIHPLGLLDVSRGQIEKELVDRTLSQLETIGTSEWVGYSWSWLANMKARAGDGQGAAKALQDFATSFVLPNSFHVNGDQSGTGKSNFTYRPFTLEGNFAFAAGIHEMLLQSYADVVRIFPAIPEEWTDVSFVKLRAEGAFLISAERQNSTVTSVTVFAEKGGVLKMQNPFETDKINIKGDATISQLDGVLTIKLDPESEINLRPEI